MEIFISKNNLFFVMYFTYIFSSYIDKFDFFLYQLFEEIIYSLD